MRKVLAIILTVLMLVGMMTVAIPASAEVVGKYDTFAAQYATGATELYIEDAEDLVTFLTEVRTDPILTSEDSGIPLTGGAKFDGKTIYLVNDITLNPEWVASKPELGHESIAAPTEDGAVVFTSGADMFSFAGTLDGQGHTVKGIYVNYNADTVNHTNSIFGVADGATIKNVRFESCYVEGSKLGTAGLFSIVPMYTSARLENVYADVDVLMFGKTHTTAGLVGRNRGTLYVDGTVYAGTIAASQEIMEIEYRTATGAIQVGGFVGTAHGGSAIYATNSAFLGKIDWNTTAQRVGKFVGRYQADVASTTLTLSFVNCVGAGSGSYGKTNNAILIANGAYTQHSSAINIILDNVVAVQVIGQTLATHRAPGAGNSTDTTTVSVNGCYVFPEGTANAALPLTSPEGTEEAEAYDLTSTWTMTPAGPMPTALLGMGQGNVLDGAVSYLGYQVKAVEGGYAIRFIGEGAFDEDIANVGLRVGVEGGNLAGLVSKVATTTKVYKGLVVGAEGGEDDYVAADGEFVYTINVGTFTADMGVITVHVTTLVDGGEGAIACQVKTVTIDTSKLPELAG